MNRAIIPTLLLLATSAARAGVVQYGPATVISQDFKVPCGLAVDGTRLLVADTGNQRIKFAEIDSLWQTAPTWTEFGYQATRSNALALNEPQAIAGDGAGNVYVVNTFNNDVRLFRWNAMQKNYVYDDSFASTTRTVVAGVAINRPRDIAVGADGQVYLLDSANHRILNAANSHATAWTVWRDDSSWGNPYGLDVDAHGTVYLADTDHSRILKVPHTGSISRFGSYGTGDGQLRNPRDVAVDADGRMVVADANNHRVTVLSSDGALFRTLGVAPLFGAPQKVVLSGSQVFVVDSDYGHVVAFLGSAGAQPFDLYLRDYEGDSGDQPSADGYTLASPDLLVRHQPDVDLSVAAMVGLESWAFEEPHYGEPNYVYLAVHNRGAHLATNAVARLYWGDPASPLDFPADWKTSGFYTDYYSSAVNTPGATLPIAAVEPRSSSGKDGQLFVGPFIWLPPTPESAIGPDGNFVLLARITHPDDPSTPSAGIDEARANNNIALRPAHVSRGPFPVGDQNTLVVTAAFPDVTASFDQTAIAHHIDDLAAWIQEVSYGLATIKPTYLGPITLDHPESIYSTGDQTLLIDMTTEVLTKLLAANPSVLSGPPAIGRIVIVLNDPAFNIDFATTGNWPFTIGGKTYYLSVSVEGSENSTARFAHGMSHQLGLEDLYRYDNVTISLPAIAGGWDNMAKPFLGQHPLVWSKQLATWPTTLGAKICYIARPSAATPITGQPPIALAYQTMVTSGQCAAIAVGLTYGVTSFNEETQFFWLEARSPSLSNADAKVPQDGVLMYYSNSAIPPGQAPIIVTDHVPSTKSLDDAALGVNDTASPPGSGITATVASKSANNGGYAVRVDYAPPVDDYDVYLKPGAEVYLSEDIWVDAQPYESTPTPGAEEPKANEDNRLYARVRNNGPATAYNVEVRFSLSQPYHTVGDKASFDLYKIVFVDHIDAGKYQDVKVVWKPVQATDPHSCVQVDLPNAFGDTNTANNTAQHNFWVDYSTHSSPYTPVNFKFSAKNSSLLQPTVIYFRAEGLPKSWTPTLDPDRAFMAPGAYVLSSLKVQPPQTAPSCTNHRVQVTGWVPRGDTLILLGGTQVDVALRDRTQVDIDGEYRACGDTKVADASDQRALEEYRAYRAQFRSAVGGESPCGFLREHGCTNPPRRNQKILVEYKDPAGNTVYHQVKTDNNGCFRDSYIAVSGGDWTATVDYPGDRCAGPAKASTKTPVKLPESRDQDQDGLPDRQEVDGDADGDGIPNFLDPDSDNDGIRDGDEPPGDLDHDGDDNVVDADSDGDGIIDGSDPRPYLYCHHSPKAISRLHFIVWLCWCLALLFLALAWRTRSRGALLIATLLLLLAVYLTWWFCLDRLYRPSEWAAMAGFVAAFAIGFARTQTQERRNAA